MKANNRSLPQRNRNSPETSAVYNSRIIVALSFLVAIIMILPIYYMLYLSFSARGKEFAFPPTVIPKPFVVGNIVQAMKGDTLPLWPNFRNSLTYAGLATIGALLTESMVGFAFARLRFPGRKILFGITVGMLIMPFVVTLIPRFLLFKQFNMASGLTPLILPVWFGGSPYGIFLMRQFFMSIPYQIDEAAKLDGAGPWRTLWLILMPQALPVLVALGMLHFAYFWNDLLGPLIYAQKQDSKVLTQGIIFNFMSNWSPTWNLFMMASLLMILPVAIVFLILQRRFRQGFLFSGLGGR